MTTRVKVRHTKVNSPVSLLVSSLADGVSQSQQGLQPSQSASFFVAEHMTLEIDQVEPTGVTGSTLMVEVIHDDPNAERSIMVRQVATTGSVEESLVDPGQKVMLQVSDTVHLTVLEVVPHINDDPIAAQLVAEQAAAPTAPVPDTVNTLDSIAANAPVLQTLGVTPDPVEVVVPAV